MWYNVDQHNSYLEGPLLRDVLWLPTGRKTWVILCPYAAAVLKGVWIRCTP
jgi:hypothetical protein